MAPKRGESIEHTTEHNEFIKKLQEYHDTRGTHLDPEPKVGVRHVDLYKLYERVVEEGGYDLVSDTKAKPLMWRKLAEEFVGKNQYTAAQAFQIKNVYYKNLCAYEITTHWNKEPPPKEILEEVTAKGGNVMTRTLENYARPPPREPDSLQNGDGSDASPEQKTPKEEKREGSEEPGSAAGRTSRGLRQQPPQRVLFQPDLTSGRQTRGALQHSHGSPTPGYEMNGFSNANIMNGASSTLASYEPSQSYPLSLKPVITPANNPEFYRLERKRKAEANLGPLARKYRHIMLPGTGFIGPNIYVRAQLALQSGLPEEEQYALHHLVKISHERGDKYRFDQFPGLAESLVKKALQVSCLFYDVEWDVEYDDVAESANDESLNGLSGTPDIVQRLSSRMPLVTNDSILDAHFISQMGRITEAGLIIRNMCLQSENAQFLSRLPLMRDYLAVVLNLPRHSSIVELQYYALETAEQMLVWCDLAPQDALYQSLLAQLHAEDRGIIITTLKVTARIAMNLSPPKRLDNVTPEILRKVQSWLLVDDEELRSACLDFLFQYTTFANNVEHLIDCVDAEVLTRQLSRLLLFGAKEQREQRPPTRAETETASAPVPRLSRSIVESLLKLDEPERSSEWLRMCFLADPGAEMTQISLWQAYQATFAPFQPAHQHLIAGDFIKNVSNTFTGATAQVAGSNKYVIKGIKSRRVPVESSVLPGSRSSDKGRELFACRWNETVHLNQTRDPVTGLVRGPTSQDTECGEWFKHGDDVLRHILQEHLMLPGKQRAEMNEAHDMDVDHKTPVAPLAANGVDGPAKVLMSALFDLRVADKATYRCRWAGCHRTSAELGTGDGQKQNTSRTALFARHIQTHLPDVEPTRFKHNLKPDAKHASSLAGEKVTLTTLTDEKGDAAGVPLGAALVLRNIAKFMPQSVPDVLQQSGLRAVRTDEGRRNTRMETLFDEDVKERLFFAAAHSKTIHHNVGSVLRAVSASGG